jgi:UDP-2-acetamido-3-amino-2,3-dideoxy-glucuronate N-acetyltransferase
MSAALPEMVEDARFPGALIHRTSVVDEGVRLGPGTRVWHFCHILPGTVVGADCSIGQNCMIGPGVVVGRGAKIQNNVSLYAGVELGEDVFLGPSCVFTNVTTPRAHVSRKSEFARTLVGRGATVGANATIVCPCTLGDYAFVGAGAVVTRDVAAHALVVGNPARPIGWVSRSGERLGDELICPRTGERYALQAGTLCLVD